MADLLDSNEVGKLKATLEAASRSTKEGIKRFVEPTHGALERAMIQRHHIVFGRRGSGKSSLLHKAASNLTVDRRPIAYVDLETFKGHSYPDVLLSVLIQSLLEFERWLSTAAISPATKTSFWQKTFGARPNRPAFNRDRALQIATEIQAQIQILRDQLHANDLIAVQRKTRRASELSENGDAGANVGISGIGFIARLGTSSKDLADHEIQETYSQSKIDFIHQHILDYRSLFEQIASLSGGDAYLFLDDLYHVRQKDQAYVLDYFHRIAKGNNLWLKVGTIRHRSQWYIHGDPPIGLKLGDDADAIDLDLTLENFTLAKRFLTAVLIGFLDDCGIASVDDILVDDAVVRLVLASGGVARDFLGIFRRSIDIARERGQNHRGARISTEDINNAAGEYDSSKREELKRDTLEERNEIEAALDRIRDFCLYQANANVFLLDKDTDADHRRAIDELVDLRLLHKVRSRVTAWDREGRVFEAYMLDISQYTGSRRKRHLEMIDFWRSSASDKEGSMRKEDKLRRAKLIYDPAADYRSALADGKPKQQDGKPKQQDGLKMRGLEQSRLMSDDL